MSKGSHFQLMVNELLIENTYFIKKVNFWIDNDLQYFSPKNHFIYWKNDFPKILEVKKKFSQQQ